MGQIGQIYRILYPDVRFDGPLDIEAEVFGSRAILSAYHSDETATISPDVWRSCDAIICYDAILSSELVDGLAHCRIIVRAGVGFDQIAIEDCARMGIPVCNSPDYGTTDVADHAIAMTLALARGIVAYHRHLRKDPREGWHFAVAPTVRRLAGGVFGVIGLGRIGTAVALRAKALGMRVMFFDPYRPSGTELALGILRASSLDGLLSQSDVVSIHTPLLPETTRLIDARAISRIKPGALLINAARGPIVDIDAALEGLRSGRLAGLALDVLPQEPPAGNEALLVALALGEDGLEDRVILTPHAAFYSAASAADMRRKSAEVAVDYLYEGRLRNCVNGLDAFGAKRR